MQFCAEIQALLENELVCGNSLSDGPAVANWPAPGSIFAALKNDLSIKKYLMPKGVKHRICIDINFGWHDECLCETHQHLLLAGTTYPHA